MAADIVFNYPVKRGKYKEKKQILFSVIELERRNGKYALNRWSEAYERFIAKNGRRCHGTRISSDVCRLL